MIQRLALLGMLLLLAACDSGWTPPVYSGHQESTEGVPGFEKGQKKSPYVKLGQSYKVMGEWYVPRFQPTYDETGMASWYGPGFHGGKTANGEEFDKHSMTAAHKTLPLPSIVRVTNLANGKSAIVRINDRGPFSKGRIIDLSYGAAKEIGLIAKGTGKVRVQYLLPESERFADLLAQGREPDKIDIASEVLPYADREQVDVAAAEIRQKAAAAPDPTVWDNLTNSEVAQNARRASPVDSVEVADLAPTAPPPAPAPAASVPLTSASPFAAMEAAPTPTPEPTPQPAEPAANGMYVQLGSFSKEANAMAVTQKVIDIGPASMTVAQRDGLPLYRVRLGPYENMELAEEILGRVRGLGLADARFVKE